MKRSVVRSYTFESAHVLPWHGGKCSRVHGHSYRLELTVQGELDDRGVVIEFGELDAIVEPVVDKLDHTLLNDWIDNPTAERIAEGIGVLLNEHNLHWSRLRLWETARGCVEIEA